MSLATGSDVRRSVASDASGFHGDYVRGQEAAMRFLPRHPSRETDWEERIAEVAERPASAAVWAHAGREAQRLGADPESVKNAAALEQGGVLCVTTGQQPGLFLGPLYTIYKAMTAVALARRVQEKSGIATVPVFWNAADDSDFGEVGTAVLAGHDLRLARMTLSGAELPAGGMVGHLSGDGTRAALQEAADVLRDRPSEQAIREHLQRALDRAADHGELTTALLYDLLQGTGVVIVDGRWPELRRAAVPLFGRYAEQRAAVADAVRAAGAELESAGYRSRISEASAEHALFELREQVRHPFPGDDRELARRVTEAPESLSPNVVLRPLVQDSVFPSVATVGGPGEISYHAQLAPVYRQLDVTMPILFPRFEATLVPPGLYSLAERRQAPLEDFVRDFDGTMKATAESALPSSLRRALAELQEQMKAALADAHREASAFEPKLGAAVDEVERRSGDAIRKLLEKVAKSARALEAARDPAIAAYRDFLRPRGVPQERVLSALALFLESTSHPLDCLGDALTEHLESTRDLRPQHWLLPLHGCTEPGS